MCLTNVSNKELINELHNRGLVTPTTSRNKIISDISNGEEFKIILTYGIPDGEFECRECGLFKPAEEFRHYQSRVNKIGYLHRSNAVCTTCSPEIDKPRQELFKNVKLEKPKKGDSCPNCQRNWFGNWHRHHFNDVVIYICGDCNMSFRDQRRKNIDNKGGDYTLSQLNEKK